MKALLLAYGIRQVFSQWGSNDTGTTAALCKQDVFLIINIDRQTVHLFCVLGTLFTSPPWTSSCQNNTRSSSYTSLKRHIRQSEPPHDKNNKMACASSKDWDQPGHTPSLIRVFAVHIKKALVLSYPLSVKQRLWSDWADAQADLSLRYA